MSKNEGHNKNKKYDDKVEYNFKSIGNGNQFYDKFYNFLHWANSGKKKKFYPKFIHAIIHNKINHMVQIHIHKANKSKDLDNQKYHLEVPKNEKISLPCIWVIELYPPGELDLLQKSLNKKGWNKNNDMFNLPNHEETLKRIRSTKGYRRWNLITLQHHDSTLLTANGIKTNLPEEVKYIDLRGVQVGSGLTAVIACFTLNKIVTKNINSTWRKYYEPELVSDKKWPRAISSKEVAIRNIKEEKARVYKVARNWMTINLPGFFSSNNEKQPLIDLILSENIKSDEMEETNKSMNKVEAYNAVGINIDDFHYFVSPNLPNMILSETQFKDYQKANNTPLWTLWGNRIEIDKSLMEFDFYKALSNGSEDINAISQFIDKNMENNFLLFSISSFLDASKRIYSSARDEANNEYSEFNIKSLKKMKNNLFTLSLNLMSIKYDIYHYWKFVNTSYEIINFRIESTASWFYSEKKGSRDFNKNMIKSQKKAFKELIDADKNYRDILSTVTALSVSEDNSKVSRRALFVAFVSLFLAIFTFLLTEIRDGSIISRIINYLQSYI